MTPMDAPNAIWTADFKGQFKTGAGRYCYPLTVTDHFSRRVLACHGFPAITVADIARWAPVVKASGAKPN